MTHLLGLCGPRWRASRGFVAGRRSADRRSDLRELGRVQVQERVVDEVEVEVERLRVGRLRRGQAILGLLERAARRLHERVESDEIAVADAARRVRGADGAL